MKTIDSKNIVINADDFGREKSRNIAIDECFKKNYISQTSLIVNNGKISDEAVELSINGGYDDKVVLHINLTFGSPLTEKIKNTPLCNNGVFVGMKNVLDTFFIYSKIKCRKAIKEECEAQIKKFINYGFEPYHLDSHNWVQTEIPVWIELYPLMKKYGFKSIRPMRKGLKVIQEKSKRHIFLGIYYRISDLLARITKCYKLNYSSGLEEYLDYDRELDNAEIFCHPNMIDGEIWDVSWSYKNNPYITMKDFSKKISNYDKYSYKELFF